MDDGSAQVRAAAAESLWAYESDRAVSRLVDALSFEKDDTVLESAFRSVKYSNDPRMLAPALKALRSGSSRVRWAAIDALESLKSPDSVEPLKRVENDSCESEGIREKARQALQLMGAE
jgi:HEAT repeat protein